MDYTKPAPWLYTACRSAVRMARGHASSRHQRVLWQERAADYREQRQGWTLAERNALVERIAGKTNA